MQATCSHTDQVEPARPAPVDVCAACVAIGSRWVHLRQCLVCGATNCCDSSPNRHATKHFFASEHPLMQNLEPGQEWAWCFVDRVTLRETDDERGWRVVDPFFDAGLLSARREIAAGRGLPFPAGSTAEDGFPLAIWESTYRGRHRSGNLDGDQAADLESLPGWSW